MTGPRDRSDGDAVDAHDSSAESVDLDAVRSVLDDQPVEVAVLFGSHVDGTADPSSDVDLAVEFDDAVSDVSAARLSLMADLSVALGRNDVDVAPTDRLAPRVGRTAFEEGLLLVGSPDRMRELQDRFEAAAAADASGRSLRDRLDAAVESVDRTVEE